MIRVLLAEDHETVRQGLKLLIDAQTDMEIVGEAGNGRVAVDQVRALAPDAAIDRPPRSGPMLRHLSAA